MDKRLLAAYRFFHERGTMREGTHGVDALAMARAERWAVVRRVDGTSEIVEH